MSQQHLYKNITPQTSSVSSHSRMSVTGIAATGSEPQRQARDPSKVAALGIMIARLEAVLNDETRSLRNGTVTSLLDSSMAKSQGILDLGRALRSVPAYDVLSVTTILARLRTAAEQNRYTLALHVEAARSVAEIITRAMRDAESDGTYSVKIPRLGNRP